MASGSRQNKRKRWAFLSGPALSSSCLSVGLVAGLRCGHYFLGLLAATGFTAAVEAFFFATLTLR